MNPIEKSSTSCQITDVMINFVASQTINISNTCRARPWWWSTSQIPLDCQFWLVKFPQLLAILATKIMEANFFVNC